MPNNKRSNRGSRRSNRNDFFGHDRRDEDHVLPISKGRSGHRDRSTTKLAYAVRQYLDDGDDFDMGQRRSGSGGFSQQKHDSRGGAPGGRGIVKGRGRRHQGPPWPQRVVFRVPESPNSWYKVTVPFAARYEKKWVVESLLAAVAPVTFSAVSYATMGHNIGFYVDNHEAAKMLQNVDQKVRTEDGYKLKVIVRPHSHINVDITEGLKEAVKNALASRYNGATVALDLSKFHNDPEVIDKYFVPLNSTSVLKALLELVTENCPTLTAINLAHNMLYTLEGLRNIATKLPHLRVLHLDHNMLGSMSSLDVLRGCELDDLTWNSNPVCKRYPEQEEYVREVRKRLPKLKQLDGVNLPPPIVFDDVITKVPPSRGSYLCAEEGKAIVCQFLEQYYAIFDSESRTPLGDAYHEDALFSLTYQQHKDDKSRNAYPPSRNLLRVPDQERRNQLLKKGRANIVSTLNGLPKTQHDPQSFIVDLSIFTPQLLMLSLMGVFRGDSPKSTHKSFFRTLVIIPQNAGFCITNETIHISPATSKQARAAFRTSLAPVAPVPTVPSPVVVPVPLAPLPVPLAALPVPVLALNEEIETKRKMVETLATQTGMNLQWSEKCLSETNWDFTQACVVFTELNKQGRVPADAFVK